LAVVIAAAAHLARLGRAGFVFAREGVFALIDTTRLPLPARAAVRTARLIERPASRVAANRLATALTRLGPSYVKLGQFLATRPDVVGAALARDLETLQDKMAPFPQAEAEREVEAALGASCSRRSAHRLPPPRSRRCTGPKSSPMAAATRSR
jgi:ubiquinone biosynthesis protein